MEFGAVGTKAGVIGDDRHLAEIRHGRRLMLGAEPLGEKLIEVPAAGEVPPIARHRDRAAPAGERLRRQIEHVVGLGGLPRGHDREAQRPGTRHEPDKEARLVAIDRCVDDPGRLRAPRQERANHDLGLLRHQREVVAGR
jgi:hypothetical protein